VSFLRILGWRVPVQMNSAALATSFAGGRVSASSRAVRVDRRRTVLIGRSFTAPHLSKEEADTLECLLSGQAHAFPFDADLWSFDGVGPVPGFVAPILGGGLFGSFARVTVLDLDFSREPLGRNVSVWVFRRAGGAGPWVHYQARTDGAVFVDGARDDEADTSWLTITPELVTLTGAPDDFDSLAVFRCWTADRCVVEAHAWQTTESRPLPRLPRLEVDGDVIAGRRYQAIGKIGAQPAAAFGGRPPAEPLAASRWRNNGRNVSFELLPVPGTVEVIP